MNEILSKYSKELEDDVKLDQLNIKDKQMMLPGLRAKWVKRLITHRQEILELNSLLEQAREKVIQTLAEKEAVGLSRPALEKAAENHESIKKIRMEIKQQEHAVDFLERIENILRSMSYDIKNIIDLMKLETT